MMNQINFFIRSNLAVSQLQNAYLRKILKDSIKMSCIKTFQTKHLMEVTNILSDLIETRLNDASYVTIIPDCCSDGANSHVLGTLKTA